MSDDMQARGQRLQALRRGHRPRISQEQMAEAVGVDVNTIGNYERGKHWDAGTVAKILDVLGEPPDALDEPERSEFVERLIDQEVLEEFSDDVVSAILFVGVWLQRFQDADAGRFRHERDRLARYLIERDRET